MKDINWLSWANMQLLIRAALWPEMYPYNKYVVTLQSLADWFQNRKEFARPEECMAAFLLGKIEAAQYYFVDSDRGALATRGNETMLPLKRSTWDFFLERCRHVVWTDAGRSENFGIKDLASKQLSKLARIGQWPTSLSGNLFFSSDLPKMPGEILQFGWVWQQDKATWKSLCAGNTESISYIEPDNRPVIGAGLTLALRRGWLEPPADPSKLVIAFNQWRGSNYSHISSTVSLIEKGLCADERMWDMYSNLILQYFALYSERAAYELARRGEKLALPLAQQNLGWARFLLEDQTKW